MSCAEVPATEANLRLSPNPLPGRSLRAIAALRWRVALLVRPRRACTMTSKTAVGFALAAATSSSRHVRGFLRRLSVVEPSAPPAQGRGRALRPAVPAASPLPPQSTLLGAHRGSPLRLAGGGQRHRAAYVPPFLLPAVSGRRIPYTRPDRREYAAPGLPRQGDRDRSFEGFGSPRPDDGRDTGMPLGSPSSPIRGELRDAPPPMFR